MIINKNFFNIKRILQEKYGEVNDLYQVKGELHPNLGAIVSLVKVCV